ncbi:MAG: DUF5654 family protein [Candidatus Aenigmatarchaeota archaeon]
MSPKTEKLNHKIIKGLGTFQKEFRKHLSTFITGAFAFVAALLWRDAIQSFLDRYKITIQELMPIKEIWFSQLFTAFAVSIVAVIAIIVISKLLKVEEEKK